MNSINCLVQADGPAAPARAGLERGLVDLHETIAPGVGASVSWQEVPAGFMFTEGRPSTTSVVSFALDRSTTLAERETLLRQVCDLFVDLTGCTVAEVLAAVAPPPTSTANTSPEDD